MYEKNIHIRRGDCAGVRSAVLKRLSVKVLAGPARRAAATGTGMARGRFNGSRQQLYKKNRHCLIFSDFIRP